MSRPIYIIAVILFFAGGAYIWKATHTGRRPIAKLEVPTASTEDRRQVRATLVYVGDVAITSDDLDWEFSLHTQGVFDSDELMAVPDLGAKYEKELDPLKQRLLAGLIERKLLYKYIEQDSSFNLQNPGRFTRCLDHWRKVMETPLHAQASSIERERLKARVCERDIIAQYLKERAFSSIVVEDGELSKYFQENPKEFNRPEKALIRQMVLASEDEAKRLRNQVNRDNFAELARKYSISPDAEDGGKVGPFARGEVPRVFDEAFSMRPGEIRGILKSTYGFHVIMLEKKFKKSEADFDESKEEIRAKITQKKREEAYRTLVESALNSIRVHPPKPAW